MVEQQVGGEALRIESRRKTSGVEHARHRGGDALPVGVPIVKRRGDQRAADQPQAGLRRIERYRAVGADAAQIGPVAPGEQGGSIDAGGIGRARTQPQRPRQLGGIIEIAMEKSGAAVGRNDRAPAPAWSLARRKQLGEKGIPAAMGFS